jgi:acylphosphatase
MEARHLVVSGRVQGVGFRWSVLAEALRHGAAGWVRNLPDGRVEVFVQGDPEVVDVVAGFVRSGPPGAHVRSCVETEAGLDDRFSSFEIRV